MASSASYFLRLPPELRNAIYREYVLVDGGYVFNARTEKLRKATAQGHGDANGAIDLSLMYTCRQVASEMKGVALGANLVTFRTLYRDDLRIRAGRYVGLIDQLDYLTAAAACLAYKICSRQVRALIVARYPWFEPYLDLAEATNTRSDRRIVPPFQATEWVTASYFTKRQGSQIRCPSLVREAALFTLRTCLEREGLRDALEEEWRIMSGFCLPIKVRQNMPDFLALTARHTHWTFPSQSDVDTLFELLHDEYSCTYGHMYDNDDCRTLTKEIRDLNLSMFVSGFKDAKYRFSAATAAIRFFELFPGIHRDMRSILIHEDRDAVPCSASHGRGLVRFCMENPLLRIERRVDLWRNVFLDSMGHRIDQRFAETDDWLDEKHPTLRRKPTTRAIGRWVMEAAELDQMPPHCFRLTLDGGAPGPANVCSDLFQHWVQASAAEQMALRLTMDRGLPMTGGPRAHIKRTRDTENLGTPPAMYFETGSSGFPDELSKIVAGTSVVGCLNFSPGSPHDVEEIIRARHGWTAKEWWDSAELMTRFPDRFTVPTFFNPVSPLPQWIELLMHNLLDYDSARQYAIDEGYL
ncbi:hypothetical protein PG985_000114 [Apiospora marii]|uniref:uncharacterized protein n=1 Tax=Apiospora marii TaxID=335849 RepID=UPI00313138BB